MGLDWNPGPKPKPGCEAEYLDLYRILDETRDEAERERLIERFTEISITAFETLKTPRVGHDNAATTWIRERYDEQDRGMSPEEWVNRFEGFYVLPLVPECDGLPLYTNGYPGGYVEAYAFRAQFLRDCEDIIGEDLLNEGFESKLPDELVRYGNALIGKAEAHAAANGIDIGKLDREPPEDPDSDDFRVHVVMSAGRWCLFWAGQGHFLEAYW